MLTEVKDYVAALPHLENATREGGTSSPAGRLFIRVAGLVATEHCDLDEFSQAHGVLARAVQLTGHGELARFAKLTAAASNGHTTRVVTDDTLKLLDELDGNGEVTDPLVARPRFVGYHRRAYDLARGGRRDAAGPYWKRAIEHWSRLSRSQAFWTSYVEAFNASQDRQLELSWLELQQRVQRKLAEFLVAASGAALRGTFFGDDDQLGAADPNVAEAQFFWSMARDLEGNDEARKLFEKIVDAAGIIESLSSTVPSATLLTICKFLESIQGQGKYNMVIADCYFTEAKELLAKGQTGRFLVALREVAQRLPEARDLEKQIRSLPYDVISTIADQAPSVRKLATIQRQDPNLYRKTLFEIVTVAVSWHRQLPGGLSPHTIRLLLGEFAESL